MPAQLAEQLLEVGQGDLLALADSRQRDRAIALTQAQIDHGGDREPAFGSESHRKFLQVVVGSIQGAGGSCGVPGFRLLCRAGRPWQLLRIRLVVD